MSEYFLFDSIFHKEKEKGGKKNPSQPGLTNFDIDSFGGKGNVSKMIF